MSFAKHVQLFRWHFPEHVTQVEIGVRDLLDLLAAHVTEISLVA
jgi:hypothetical protein